MIISFGPHFNPKSFSLFLDDAGIIRNSFPISSLLFCLAWNNKASRSFTISQLHMHLFIFSHHCRNCQSWDLVQPSGKYVYLWMCINMGILIFAFKHLWMFGLFRFIFRLFLFTGRNSPQRKFALYFPHDRWKSSEMPPQKQKKNYKKFGGETTNFRVA